MELRLKGESMVTKKSAKPRPKVVGATFGAALAALILWLLQQQGVDVSTFPEWALIVVVTFAGGWLTPEND